jgi:hypothetical protein
MNQKFFLFLFFLFFTDIIFLKQKIIDEGDLLYQLKKKTVTFEENDLYIIIELRAVYVIIILNQNNT